MRKVILALGLFLFTTACDGGSDITTPSKSLINSAINQQANLDSNSTTALELQDSQANKKYAPKDQSVAVQKIYSYLNNYDFKGIMKEYDSNGLKFTAIKGEHEFSDYPLNYTITSILNNAGEVGLNPKNIWSMDQSERRSILDVVMKQVLMYGIRSDSNRVVENNQNGLSSNPKFGSDLVNGLSTYYYGSENQTVTEKSPAEFTQKVDSDYKVNIYPTIIEGINTLKANNNGDINQLIQGRDKVQLGLLKALYISILGKVAQGIVNNDTNSITEAEYDYLSIKNTIKSNDNSNTYKAERPFFVKLTPNRIDYNEFEYALASGFIEKGMQEMQSAIDNISTTQSAINSSNLAKSYIDIVNTSYQNKKVSKESNVTILNSTNAFINAIKAGDKNKANNLKNQINDNLFSVFKIN